MPESKTGEVDDELETDASEEDDELDDDDEAAAEEVPASAAGKASAVRLLDLMLEKKALALHAEKPSKDLIEAVAKAIEWPGTLGQRANKLSNAIVDSEDVDELFIDDETLGELLKRW